MFKVNSCENELIQSMQKNMDSNKSESKHSLNKLVRAVDYLNSTVSIFEKAGMHQEAQAIVKVLSKIATQLSGKLS